MAKLYHPDRHRDATEAEVERAEELFRQVKQTYEVLGTEERRKLYDRYGDIALNPNLKVFKMTMTMLRETLIVFSLTLGI